jgi:hypothetical protein
VPFYHVNAFTGQGNIYPSCKALLHKIAHAFPTSSDQPNCVRLAGATLDIVLSDLRET